MPLAALPVVERVAAVEEGVEALVVGEVMVVVVVAAEEEMAVADETRAYSPFIMTGTVASH